MKVKFSTYFSLIAMVFMLVGCHKHQLTTRHLKGDEKLLKKVKIDLKGNHELDKEELALYIRQKPNRAILFGTWRLGLQWDNIWYKPDGEKENPAVILDTSLIYRSERQLKIYLQNQGFYNAYIGHNIKYTQVFGNPKWETKKAEVTYTIDPGSPVKIDSLGYNIKQAEIASYYKQYQHNRKLKKGKILKIDQLQEERERISSDLQNRGYYDFADNFISFDVDTSAGKNKTVVITKIKQPKLRDSLHRRYSINNIYVHTNYDPYSSNNITTDTIHFQGVDFISRGPSKFKPDPLYRSIFFREGEFYNQKRQSLTYRQFANLQMFGFIKIEFRKVADDLGRHVLDAYILLSPAKKMAISTEIMGIYREGFGANGQVSFSNKNAFGRSEIVNFSISGGVESLKLIDEDDRKLGTNIGPRLSITFPRLFLLGKVNDRIRKNAFPKTSISTYFNFQQRTRYTRYLTNASMKYEFNEGRFKKHEISIPEINFSFITKDSDILNNLDGLTLSQKFKFEDAISSGIKYTFSYNNQVDPKVKNPDYLNLKGYLVGPSALIASALGIEARDANNAIILGGVRYATFFKAQGDYRKYFNFIAKQQIALRGFIGFSTPLDKHGVIPFDQLYFSGGANSIRGWQQRTLGPGSFTDPTNNIDRLGEIKLEANAEYRFPITSILKGALFVDAGNVWTEEADTDEDDYDPNFEFNRFYKEIAVSSGLGIRFDFDFFLFRLDVGVPVKQAYNRITWKTEWEGTQYNFGVGYPF